jgi:hypothetical protein
MFSAEARQLLFGVALVASAQSHGRLSFSAFNRELNEPVKFRQGNRFGDKGERTIGEHLFLHFRERTPRDDDYRERLRKRPHVLKEQDGVHQIGTPFWRIRTGPHGPRRMDTEHQNQVEPSTLEHLECMVTVRNRLNLVATIMMKMLGKHRHDWMIATD